VNRNILRDGVCIAVIMLLTQMQATIAVCCPIPGFCEIELCSKDYTVVGSRCRLLETISTSTPAYPLTSALFHHRLPLGPSKGARERATPPLPFRDGIPAGTTPAPPHRIVNAMQMPRVIIAAKGIAPWVRDRATYPLLAIIVSAHSAQNARAQR
jgi:hypothetical protein